MVPRKKRNSPRRWKGAQTAQDREDARVLARTKRILQSPRDGKLIAESRVLRELGRTGHTYHRVNPSPHIQN